MLEQIQALDDVSVLPLLLSDTNDNFVRREKESKLVAMFREFAESSHQTSIDACGSKNIEHMFGGSMSIRLTASPNSSGLALDPETSEDIADKNFDVILALDALDCIDHFRHLSKFGIWYFWHDFGQTTHASGSRVGLWEVIKRRPYIRSALIIRNADERKNIVAYESYSGVQNTSFRQSRDEHLWKVQSFVSRALKQMHREGAEQYLLGLTENDQTEIPRTSQNEWRLTTANLILPMIAYLLWRLWRKAIREFFVERWMLLFSLSGDSEDMSEFTVLRPPDDRFWADPHVFRRNDDHYVFFEDASVSSGRGHIAVMRLGNDGAFSSPKTVIERDYHLSYPFVFEWRNQIYLIPESAENQTIELYRCKEFPFDWEYSHDLMENVLAYDTTLIEHDGIWWLFANMQQHAGASSWDELCLFYSDSPISTKWFPHPMNPVVSDVRYARPAGKVFSKNEKLFRPSQNSSHRYGYGLNICEIIEMSTTSYKEKVIRKVLPDWHHSLRCVHTFSQTDDLVMIDAICRTRR